MSFNRENIVWQSANGKWNIGFYEVAWEDEDGDPEWDVEYDFTKFSWASTGHATEEAAWRAWTGANPGGYSVMPYTDENATAATDYDLMAAAWKQEERASRIKYERAYAAATRRTFW